MPIKWKKQWIADEGYESAGVFDVNNDGVLDIVSGAFWYQGPDFRKKHDVGEVKKYGEYYDDFSTIALDINGDDYLDFVTGGWWGNTLRWRENPKGDPKKPWTKYNNACERAQREWDRFHAALENHEKAHESLYGEMADKMAADMVGLTATAYACTREAAEKLADDRLTARVRQIIQKRSQEYDQKQIQFDNADPAGGVAPVACP